MESRTLSQRTLSAASGLSLLLGLAGCGGGSGAAAPASEQQATPAPLPQGIMLSTTVGSPTKVAISWVTSKTTGDKYEIYRNGELDTSAVGSAEGTYDTGLAPGTQYCYQVTVTNPVGAGMASSNQSCVTTAPLAGWDITTIQTAPPLSLSLDPQGRERVSFCASSGVYFQARQADGSWNTAEVDASASCFNALLAVGGDGSDHIIYVDDHSNELKYATDVSGSWSVSTVPGADGAEFYTLALDSGNNLHVAYELFTGQAPDCYQIVYASNANGGWQETVVASAQGYPVIAVDGNGAAYIAYLGEAQADGSYPVHYMTDASGSWTDSAVAASQDGKTLLGLAVDAAGHADLVYKSQAQLEYASDISGSWKVTQVDSFDAAGPEDDSCGAYDVSIALDSAGQPHLSYEDTSGNLKYASLGTRQWATSYVDTEGTQNQIRMDASGHAHISYGNAQNLYSKLAVSP